MVKSAFLLDSAVYSFTVKPAAVSTGKLEMDSPHVILLMLKNGKVFSGIATDWLPFHQ